MQFVQFISTDYMKIWTVVPDNVDDNLLATAIRKAQVINIRTFIGDTLYNKLSTDLVANTLSGDYLSLMNDYIMPALAEWSVWHLLPWARARITNKSVSLKSSDHSTPVPENELITLRHHSELSAKKLEDLITQFLLQHQATIPEWHNINSPYNKPPKSENITLGIYTGRGKYNLGGIPWTRNDGYDYDCE